MCAPPATTAGTSTSQALASGQPSQRTAQSSVWRPVTVVTSSLRFPTLDGAFKAPPHTMRRVHVCILYGPSPMLTHCCHAARQVTHPGCHCPPVCRTSVDLAAPGSSILSTSYDGSGYVTMSGTSMAAPFVSGAAAILRAAVPAASSDCIRTSLLATVDPLPSLTTAVATGVCAGVVRPR